MTSTSKLLTWPFMVFMLTFLICGRGLMGEAAQVSSLELNSVFKPADSISLLSGNRIFAAGFITAGAPGAYAFGIWYAAIPNSPVVWLANRDRLVDKNSFMALTQKGNMVLSTSDGTVIWATDTSDKGVKKAVLQDGNLVLLASGGGSPVWQSFDDPTDTLLPMQQFLRNISLVSKKKENTYASGNYKLSFNSDNRLSLTYTGVAVAAPEQYWVDLDSMDQAQQYGITGGGGQLIVASAGMNTTGGIIISDGLNFMTSDFGDGFLRRLTLDSDGNLRVYSWDQSSSNWHVVWRAIQQQCKIYGMCGPNALCVDKPDDTYICICPTGFHAKNSSDTFLSLGCEPNIVLNNCTTHVQSSTSYKFISLEFVNYQGHDLLPLSSATMNECETACRNNCSCVGFYYTYDQVSWKALGSQNCYLKAKLLNGYRSPDAGRMFFKVSALESAQGDLINSTNSMNLICLPNVHLNYPKMLYRSHEVVRVVSVSCSILVLEIILGVAAAYFLMAKFITLREAQHYGLEILSGRPKKSTLSEIEAATDNFSEILGKGGYGTVYKGHLPDNSSIAVKRIDRMSEGEEEFWAEVTIICRIHHLNLVRMRGFCAQGEHRLLVYEYVPNGSLDTYLFSGTCTLDWKKRYQIALGTARGIAYLHEECLEWILHCDIKPENVLLDDNFCPKVSDFGMAKLVNRETAFNVSSIRGTRGYLAPEWMEFDQPITAKADVYSFGMVLMEIISGRKNFEFSKSAMDGESMSWCFPVWAHKLVTEGKLKEVVDGRIVDDPEVRWDEVERVPRRRSGVFRVRLISGLQWGKLFRCWQERSTLKNPLILICFPFLKTARKRFSFAWTNLEMK